MGRKLTPRQLAGRMNRAKRKGLTPEGREALRQAAIANRPWEHSTGPRTLAGKAMSRWNAYQHGDRACELQPESVKRFRSMVARAEVLAGQGLVFVGDYRKSVVAEAVEEGTATPGQLLILVRLIARLIRAELQAVEVGRRGQPKPRTLGDLTTIRLGKG